MRTRKGSYEVGYRRPPKASQFRPGSSGNPKGRPKRFPSVEEMFAAELNRSLTIQSAEGATRIPMKVALIRQFLKLAAKGHSKALFSSLEMLENVQRKKAKIDAQRAAPKYTKEMIEGMTEQERTDLYMETLKQAHGSDREHSSDGED